MKHVKEHWLPYLLVVIITWLIVYEFWVKHDDADITTVIETLVPDIESLPDTEAGEEVRYGKALIENTAHYLGPNGAVAAISNGLNCQNCHREGGTKLFTNNFLAVAHSYPKYRERSGVVESIEYRVNDCLKRSLNGKPIDSLSKEMRAMVAYIKWVGKNVDVDNLHPGVGTKELPLLQRAASVQNGKAVYTIKCQSCHGENGEGVYNNNSTGVVYPALWGDKSYAVSAGMFRLTRLASFIAYNMPPGATYQQPMLSAAEAWDAAAYINSKPHPMKIFASDWPNLESKPVDYPFGPYADAFSEEQHKYGPFQPIKKAMKK